MGRPTDEPKTLNTRIRLSQADIDMLDFCSKSLDVTKAEVIRMGVKKVYNELKK